MTLSFNQNLLKIYSIFFAKKIGEDEYGNMYFTDKKERPSNNHRQSRWIIYKDEVEASKVPQEWNAWLHHVTNVIPKIVSRKPKWIKKHKPNLTGTNKANNYGELKIKDKINNIYSLWKPK